MFIPRIRQAVAATALMMGVAACGDSAKTTQPDGNNPGPAPVASVTLTPATATLSQGQTRQLTATAYSASNAVITGKVHAFTSTVPAVAVVSQTGLVTAIGDGETKVRVTIEGKSAEATITVQPTAVASVEINPDIAEMDVGANVTAQAVAKDANDNVLPNRVASWQINTPNVATIDNNGKIVGVSPGTATITATIEGKVAQAGVVVRAVVASVEIQIDVDTIEMYDLKNLTAIARDANGLIIPNVPFTWTTTNANVGAVNTDGVLSGVDRGSVQITATSPNGKFDVVTRVVVIKYRSVTLGTQHACNIASGGVAHCWGLNSVNGRIGLAEIGDGVFRAAPIIVPGNHKFTQLVTYARTTCGLRVDGLAYCWGTNNWGSLGSGANIGYSSTPVAVAGNHVFTRLVAGAEHACGLKATGALYCWGHGDWGQFGNGTTTGSVTPIVAAGGMQFVNVSAGSTVTCGVNNVGAAYCWGANGLGQLGIGGQIAYGNVYLTTPQAVVGGHQFASITVGEQFTCGVNLNGQAFCWGIDGHRLGAGNTGDASSPKAVSGGHNFKWLNSGFSHSCGINAQDDVYCWGSNGYGQLGIPNAFASIPTLVAGGFKAAEVDVAGIGTGSGGFTCAIAKNRLTTYCWGRNEFGQLGNGATNPAASVNHAPTIVQGQRPL